MWLTKSYKPWNHYYYYIKSYSSFLRIEICFSHCPLLHAAPSSTLAPLFCYELYEFYASLVPCLLLYSSLFFSLPPFSPHFKPSLPFLHSRFYLLSLLSLSFFVRHLIHAPHPSPPPPSLFHSSHSSHEFYSFTSCRLASPLTLPLSVLHFIFSSRILINYFTAPPLPHAPPHYLLSLPTNSVYSLPPLLRPPPSLSPSHLVPWSVPWSY